MKSLQSFLAAATLALVLVGGSAPTVQAQTPAPAPSQPAGENLSVRWAMAYGLTGLGVVLGLLNVCRPGKRKGDSPKPS